MKGFAMEHGLVRKHTRIVTFIFSVLFALFFVGLNSPAYVSADISDTACQGFEEALGSGSCGGGGGNQVGNTLATVINVLSIVVGVIAVFVIIIAGIRYITSQGDPGTTKSARDTIIYAIVGLMIVALAQALVRYVLNETGQATAGGGGGGGGPSDCSGGPPC